MCIHAIPVILYKYRIPAATVAHGWSLFLTSGEEYAAVSAAFVQERMS